MKTQSVSSYTGKQGRACECYLLDEAARRADAGVGAGKDATRLLDREREREREREEEADEELEEERRRLLREPERDLDAEPDLDLDDEVFFGSASRDARLTYAKLYSEIKQFHEDNALGLCLRG